MKCRFLMLALVLLLMPVASFADWSDTDYDDEEEEVVDDEIDVLYVQFDGEFPPPGWTIIQNNPDKTWEQQDCEYGGVCAHVEGSISGSSNEFLISPPIENCGCHRIHASFSLDSLDDEGRREEQILWYWSFADGGDLTERDWNKYMYEFDYRYDKPFQIAVRFQSEGSGAYNLEFIRLFCYDTQDDEEGGCGCTASTTSAKHGFALTFIMLLIGIVALAVSLRVKPTS